MKQRTGAAAAAAAAGNLPPRQAGTVGRRAGPVVQGAEGGRQTGHVEQHVQQYFFFRQLRVFFVAQRQVASFGSTAV